VHQDDLSVIFFMIILIVGVPKICEEAMCLTKSLTALSIAMTDVLIVPFFDHLYRGESVLFTPTASQRLFIGFHGVEIFIKRDHS